MAIAAKRKKRLTAKQEIFCQEYLKQDNASAAYRIAYNTKKWKSKSVNEVASKLLKNTKVRSRVKELQKIAAEIAKKEFRIDSKVLLKHLNILRKSRIDKYVNFVKINVLVGFNEKGKEIRKEETILQFKPFNELTEEELMCVESIKETRNGIELKLHGKDWTIEKIAKHIGFYEKDNIQRKAPAFVVFDGRKKGKDD